MYKLNAFIKIDAQKDNTLGIVANLGELSTQSLTYAKEKGIYRSQTYPGISIVSFTSKNNNNDILVPQAYSEHTLRIANRAIEYATAAGQSVTATAIANDILNQYAAQISNFEIGPLVSTASLVLPEWMSWQNPALQGGDNRIKIWFSDQAFKRQFDEYEIVIINPVSDLMDLMRNPVITETALSEMTPERVTELVSETRGVNPETVLRAQTYTLTSILQPNRSFQVTWYALVYGRAGDNPDIIKNKIIEQLNLVEGVTINEWRQAVPTLFKTTEFMIVPKWLNQAIADRTTQAGIYSPFGNVKEQLDFMIDFFEDIDSEHVEFYLQSLTLPYRSITMYCISSPDNLNNLFRITEKYNDLINAGTSSADFSRMSNKTQAFATMMQELLIIAENETSYSELPTNVRRVIRYNKTWIVRNFDGVQYLIYAKSNDTV